MCIHAVSSLLERRKWKNGRTERKIDDNVMNTFSNPIKSKINNNNNNLNFQNEFVVIIKIKN